MRNTNKSYVIVCLYVDDMLALGSNDHMIKSTRKMLTNKLDMKDLSVANIILKIKSSKKYNGFILSLFYYVEKILKKFSKDYNSNVKIPIDISVYMSKNRDKGINQLKYSQIIKNLMYIMNCIMSRITCLLNKLSRFNFLSLFLNVLRLDSRFYFVHISVFKFEKGEKVAKKWGMRDEVDQLPIIPPPK